MSVQCPDCGAIASYGYELGHRTGCPQLETAILPPRRSGLPFPPVSPYATRNDMRERIEKLEKLLAEHHKWHCEAEGLFMFYENPESKRIECTDISGEYGDSDLFERTASALNGN